MEYSPSVRSVFTPLSPSAASICTGHNNITASITIFFAFPYKIGDRIRILDKDDSVTGIITEIGLFYVRVRDDNGDLVTYPANLILQKPVRRLEGKEAESTQPE